MTDVWNANSIAGDHGTRDTNQGSYDKVTVDLSGYAPMSEQVLSLLLSSVIREGRTYQFELE